MLTLDYDSELFKNPKIPGFLAPRYDGYCISNIPDSMAKILHSSYRAGNCLKDKRFYELCEDSENLIFLLLDGLGYKLIQHAQRQHGLPAFDLVTKNATVFPLTTVFPSTTSSATTTLHTGLTPQEHGVIGYTMYLREIGTIAEMLKFSPITGGRESIFDYGLDPASFVGSQTIHEKLKSSGIISNLYIYKYIMDSGLSKITNRGAEIHPHVSAADMFVKLRKNLESQKSTSFHFAYFASPDTIAHSRGPFSAEFASEVESVFHILYRELFQKLNRKTAQKTSLVISADHGLVHVKEHQTIDIQDHANLEKMLKVPITGDSRAGFLHVKEGKSNEVMEYFQKNLSDIFEVHDSGTLLRNGFFGAGAVKQEVPDRIGNLAVLAKHESALENSVLETGLAHIPGRHGGMSENEMLVPLAVTKLSEKVSH